MLEFSTTAPVDVERITIFKIDGVEYTIPAEFDANLALDYLEMVKAGTTGGAELEMLRRILGEDAFAGLRGAHVSLRQLKELLDNIGVMIMGQMETVGNAESTGN